MALAKPELRDDRDPVGEVLTTVVGEINNGQEKSWHLHLHAPRWSVGKGRRHSEQFAIWMFVLSVALAAAGVALAIHFVDRFLPGGASGAATPQAPLAVQIGSWSVVFVVFAGAVAAGLLGFRAPRLEVELSARPSAEAEAERAEELRNHAIDVIVAHLNQQAQRPPNRSEASNQLQSLAVSPQSSSGAAPQQGQLNAPNSASPSSTTTVADPASTISPKVIAGAGAAATSVAFWVVAATTFWHTVEPSVLTALSTGVTAAAGSIAAWLKKDPLRTTHTVESHPT